MSLLPAGITGVDGDFEAGDPVDLVTADGLVVARGLVGFSSTEVPDLLGHTRFAFSPIAEVASALHLLACPQPAGVHQRWVREARGKARRAGQPLTVNLLVETVREGAPALPNQVRRLVAFHEAGHAVANVALGVAKPVALSIGADGNGETNSIVDEIRTHTRHDIEQYLVSILAGRAAEEIACGITTAGAGGGA